MALGATLVSVTGVVVGMRSAIASLAEQLKEQSTALKVLALEVQGLAKELAVIKYAQGIVSERNE
jgi:cell division protein FtsX